MHWFLSKWKRVPARCGVQRTGRARRALSVGGNSRRLHRLEILEPRLALSIGGGGTNGNDTLVATTGSDFQVGYLGDDTYLFDNINSIGVNGQSGGLNHQSGYDAIADSGGGFDIIKFTDPLAVR